MNKSEAIALLAACKPLANRLATQGVTLELSHAEHAALNGFKQLADYEGGKWLEDAVVRSKAHVPMYKISALYLVTAALVYEEKQWQRESGEQVD